MCGCEPGYACSRCNGTADDDRRELEPEPFDPWRDYPHGAAHDENDEPPEGWRA